MMRQGEKIATAVRDPQGKIIIKDERYFPLAKRFKLFGLPFIRGFFSLVEMMVIGTKNLIFSAEIASEDKIVKTNKQWEVPLALLISLVFVITFYTVIPAYFFTIIKSSIANDILLNLAEGGIRLGLLLVFLFSTLLMPDMRRVFMYHGAEHKTVQAWEAGEDLTIANIRKYSRFHPRCGTSFLLIVMLTAIIIFTFLGRPDFLHRILYKLALLPLISGIAYEFIRFTGKHRQNILVKMLIFPGILLQNITTKEPSDDQIEVAIVAMKKVI